MRAPVLIVVLLAVVAAPAQASRGFVLPPLPGARAIQALGSHRDALVELKDQRGAFALQAAGGTLISPALRIWKVPGRAAARLVPSLIAAGTVSAALPDLLMRRDDGHLTQGDPLIPTEWWIPVIGDDTVEPPGPGVPLTMIDSGLDMTHPEFANRPNTTLLNQQTIVVPDDEHGTATSSVAAAPANGIGLIGVYPQANLRFFDASPGADIPQSAVIQGIDMASQIGRGVINLSLGSPDPNPLMALAVDLAFSRGTIVVASAGNDFQSGNPRDYPASFPHVLTVAATKEDNTPAVFSSSNDAVDLAAPGVDIPVAVPFTINPTGYDTLQGTSFSAPLVSGATAWVWTVRSTLEKTQVYDLMRWSAKDVWDQGWDKDTGFGVLNIPNALTQTPPTIDPQEPNDDVFEVKGSTLFPVAKPFVAGTFGARLDSTEDPEDVYRVKVPAHSTVTVTMKPDKNVDLDLWGPATVTVGETGAAQRRDLLRWSTRPGAATDQVVWTNKGKSAVVVYADVFFPTDVPTTAAYTLSVKTARAR